MQPGIDISCSPGPQQQTRRTLLQRSITGTDRRTDTVPLHRPCHILFQQINRGYQTPPRCGTRLVSQSEYTPRCQIRVAPVESLQVQPSFRRLILAITCKHDVMHEPEVHLTNYICNCFQSQSLSSKQTVITHYLAAVTSNADYGKFTMTSRR